jgi:hypothetical protein
MKKHSIVNIIFSNLLGFIFFLIFLIILNLIAPKINNLILNSTLEFFNSNISILLLLTFVGLLSEIFWSFYLPFNLIAPFISAVFSYVIVLFFNKFWIFLNNLLKINIILPFNLFFTLIPLIVMVFGFILIIIRIGRPRHYFEQINYDKLKPRKNIHEEIKMLEKEVNKIKWEEVGEEFKEALLNLGKRINNLFESNNKKTKKKKKIASFINL